MGVEKLPGISSQNQTQPVTRQLPLWGTVGVGVGRLIARHSPQGHLAGRGVLIYFCSGPVRLITYWKTKLFCTGFGSRSAALLLGSTNDQELECQESSRLSCLRSSAPGSVYSS